MSNEYRDVLKDKEHQKYYDAMFEMFASEGWKYFTEELEKELVRVRDINNVSAEKPVMYRMGQQDILLWATGMPDMHRLAYDQMMAEQRVGEE